MYSKHPLPFALSLASRVDLWVILRPAAQSSEVAWGSAVMCVCRAPKKHSNRSNPTRTQLRFSYKSRVRMRVRRFGAFPNTLGYTAPRGRLMWGVASA